MPRAALALIPLLALAACSTSSKDEVMDAPRLDGGTQAELAADQAMIKQARSLLAQGKPSDAQRLLTEWIDIKSNSASPWYPEALFLRGNAKLAQDDEWEALYDYEKVAKNHPGSDVFPLTLEQEYEVAKLYLAGRRKKTLGLRIDSGVHYAEEIILRINERLPGSTLAETALLDLADFYYRTRDLKMAGETYDVFIYLYPRSAHRSKALQRRAFASIAQYKGPYNDDSGLTEARYQIEDFQREFPLDAERLGMSDALQARLDESSAQQVLVAAKWHLDRNDEPAAKYVLYRLMRKYPGSGASREALALYEQYQWPLPGAAAPDSTQEAQPQPQPDPLRAEPGQ